MKKPTRCRLFSSLILILMIFTTVATTKGQSTNWLTGAQFDARLKSRISTTWNQPLRDVAQSLRNNFQICVFVDRRIDPEQNIELQVEELSLEQTLRRLALTANADLSFVRNVVYLGPQNTTNLLATVAEIQSQNLRSALPQSQPALFKPLPTTWNRPANPRDILGKDAAKYDLQYHNPNAIPFDLWDTGQLAALPFAYRTTILLAGFGKTFHYEGDGRLNIIDFPQQASLQRAITKTLSPENLKRVRSQFPTLDIKATANSLTVSGRWEEIEQLQTLLNTGKSTNTKPATPGKQVYTLAAENQPIQAILQHIAQQEKLRLSASDSAKQVWNKRITIEAKQLSLMQLLTRVVSQTSLTYMVKDGELIIETRTD